MSTPEKPQAPNAAEDSTAKRDKLEADISKSANRVMKHMNADHEDSLVAYVLAFATGVEGTDSGKDTEDALLQNIRKGRLAMTSAQLTSVDIDGFLLEVKAVETPESEVLVLSNVRVPYYKPIESAKDLHHTAIAMHRKAYDKLGYWYKTKNGYYKQVVKMVAFLSYKKIQKSAHSTSVVAGVAAATVAAGYLIASRHRSRSLQ